VLVLDKPPGMAVHAGTAASLSQQDPAHGHLADTSNNNSNNHIDTYLAALHTVSMHSPAMLSQPRQSLESQSESKLQSAPETHPATGLPLWAHSCFERPRLVHRLDKATSGVLVVAKTRLAAKALTDQFAAKTKAAVDATTKSTTNKHHTNVNANRNDRHMNDEDGDNNGVYQVKKLYWALSAPLPSLSALNKVSGVTLNRATTTANHAADDDVMVLSRMVQASIAQSPLKHGSQTMNRSTHATAFHSVTTIETYATTDTGSAHAFHSTHNSTSKSKTKALTSRGGKSGTNGAAVEHLTALSLFTELTTLTVPAASSDSADPARSAPVLSLLAMSPVTGRKHQLRRHCGAVLSSPLLGEDLITEGYTPLTTQSQQQPNNNDSTRLSSNDRTCNARLLRGPILPDSALTAVATVVPRGASARALATPPTLHLTCRSMAFQHPLFTAAFEGVATEADRARVKAAVARAGAAVTAGGGDWDGVMAVTAPLPKHMELVMKALVADKNK